jgi:hypothetical protein
MMMKYFGEKIFLQQLNDNLLGDPMPLTINVIFPKSAVACDLYHTAEGRTRHALRVEIVDRRRSHARPTFLRDITRSYDNNAPIFENRFNE